MENDHGDHLSRIPSDHNSMMMSENSSPSTIDESHLLQEISLTQPQRILINTSESISETYDDGNTTTITMSPESRSTSTSTIDQ